MLYDSMMDGLGKEIDAGTENNLRSVELDIVYASDKALVCVVPTPTSSDDNDDDNDDDTNVKNGFGKDGKNVLLFPNEDELDLRLEELRLEELRAA